MVSLIFYKDSEFKEIEILLVTVFGSALANLVLAQAESITWRFIGIIFCLVLTLSLFCLYFFFLIFFYWHLYFHIIVFLACFFGMATVFCPIAITSIKSKMTSDTDYAKVLALCSLFERLGFRLAHLYNYIFETQISYSYMSCALYFGAIMHITCIPATL